MALPRSVAVFSDIPFLYKTLCECIPKINFTHIKADDPNILNDLNKAEVIIADFNHIGPYIYKIPNAQWVQGTWAGVEKLLPHYIKEKGPPPFPILRFTEPHLSSMMSEYVVSQVVAFERNFYISRNHQNANCWETDGKISNFNILADMTVGVLGIGNIGSSVAKVMKCFGSKVWGLVNTIPKKKLDFIDEYRTSNEIDELLENCNLLVNVLPNTKYTKGMLTLEKFSKCKGSLFVNIGRGSIAKEEDIIAALEKGYLRGAILDVFQDEPLDTNSKLWQNTKVVITPHVSGVTRAKDVASLFKNNLKVWQTGETFKNLVNFEQEY